MKISKSLLSVAAVAALSTSAFADNTLLGLINGASNGARLDAMGLYSFQTSDAFTMFANPAAIAGVKNIALLHTAGIAGATVDLGSAGVLGAFTGAGDTITDVGGSADTNVKVNHLIYGTDLGFGLVGAKLAYGTYGTVGANLSNTSGNSSTDTASDMGITVGVVMKSLPLGVILDVDMPSSTYSAAALAAAKTTTSYAPTNLTGAVTYGLGDIAITGAYIMNTNTKTYTDAATSTNNTTTSGTTNTLLLNAAYNKKTPTSLFVAAIGVTSATTTSSYDANGTASDTSGGLIADLKIPVNLAFEAKATDALTLRAGAKVNIFSNVATTGAVTSGTTASTTTVTASDLAAATISGGFSLGLAKGLSLEGVLTGFTFNTGGALLSSAELIYSF